VHIDHIGYVVSDISMALERFVGIYGFTVQGEIIFDPAQRVNLVMLNSTNNYNIELIQPIDKKSPSYDFMKKGGGFHHFCYVVEDIEKTINKMKANGHFLIKRPVKAPLLNQRQVAFLFSKIDKQIIELVENTEG